jgi:glycosyltransferase involved in cell wall biosynthesis
MKVCDAFYSLGHDVQLWLPGSSPKEAWHELASIYGIQNEFPIRWLSSLALFRRYDFALRAVVAGRRWGADLHYVWTLQAAAIASKLNIPTVLEMHDRPPGRFGPTLFRWYLKGKGAKRVLPITKALQSFLSETYETDLHEPVSVISPMGVNLESYLDLPISEEARSTLNLTEKFTVGYTGHLYKGRGLDLILELAIRNPEVQFLWVGGEPEALHSWQGRLVQEGVTNIILQGFVPNENLPLYQAACDVLLMPYEHKVSISGKGDTSAFASPMKIFEYMAAGRVIFSSDLPVLLEILNTDNAVILPIQDVNAWDAALKEIMGDQTRRSSLGKQAREDVKNYSWEERMKRAVEGI